MAAGSMITSARWSPHQKSAACRRFFYPVPIALRLALVHLLCRNGIRVLLFALLVTPSFAKLKTFNGANVDMSTYKTYQWMPPRVLTKTGIVEDDPNVAPAV